MASSTTSPVASSSASSVIRLIEKPIAHSAASVPISDTGIATTGISVARHWPMNRPTTAATISHRQRHAEQHLADRAADEHRVVGHDADAQARVLGVQPRDRRAHAVGDRHAVGLRLAHDAQADDGAAVQPHIGLGVGGVEVDLGHVAQRGCRRAGAAPAPRPARETDALARTSSSCCDASRLPAGTSARAPASTAMTSLTASAARGQRRRVQAHAQHALALAEQRHVGDAGHRDQLGLDAVLDRPRQRVDRQRRRSTPPAASPARRRRRP